MSGVSTTRNASGRVKPGASKVDPFPWNDALGFLMGTLGWSPTMAWATTLPELRLAYEGRYGRASSSLPGREALSALIAAFPDIPENETA